MKKLMIFFGALVIALASGMCVWSVLGQSGREMNVVFEDKDAGVSVVVERLGGQLGVSINKDGVSGNEVILQLRTTKDGGIAEVKYARTELAGRKIASWTDLNADAVFDVVASSGFAHPITGEKGVAFFIDGKWEGGLRRPVETESGLLIGKFIADIEGTSKEFNRVEGRWMSPN